MPAFSAHNLSSKQTSVIHCHLIARPIALSFCQFLLIDALNLLKKFPFHNGRMCIFNDLPTFLRPLRLIPSDFIPLDFSVDPVSQIHPIGRNFSYCFGKPQRIPILFGFCKSALIAQSPGTRHAVRIERSGYFVESTPISPHGKNAFHNISGF